MYYVYFHVPKDYKEMANKIAQSGFGDIKAAKSSIEAIKEIIGSVFQLPVAPGAINFSYSGKNKTVELINGEDINIIKKQGLTGISFSFLIPHTRYPFAHYGVGGFKGIVDILKNMQALKNSALPFQFIVARMQGNKLMQSTNIKVTLEEYSIEENADNGRDQMCNVTLKQYVPYSTKILTVDKDGNAVAQKVRG